MKVLLLANMSEDEYSLLKYFENGLKSLGHDTKWFPLLPRINITKKVYLKGRSTVGTFIKRASTRLAKNRIFWHKQTVFNNLIKTIEEFKPELILTVTGINLDKDILTRIANKGIPVFHYFTEPIPFNDKKFLETIPLYECIFTYNGEFIKQWDSLGAKDVKYLPFASDPGVHKPVNLTEKERVFFQSPISYIAAWQPGVEYWPEKIADFGLKIWGNQWYYLKKNSPLKNTWQGEDSGMGENFARVCSGAKIIFNLVREKNGQSHSQKTFEIPSCGAFMLTKRTEDQLEFFPEDVAAVYFQTEEELLEKIKFYLKNDDERNKIAAKGFEIAKSHRYSHRMQEVVNRYKKL